MVATLPLFSSRSKVGKFCKTNSFCRFNEQFKIQAETFIQE